MRGETGIIPTFDVSGNNNSGLGNGGWGNDFAWIIILFLIFGWGNRGNNGNGGYGGSSGAADNYVLASDFATLQRQLSDGFNSVNRKSDAIQEGICDSTFALNNTITNGNFNILNGITQGFAGINQNIVAQGYENRLGTQNLGYQLSNCCCDIQKEIAKCCCETQSNIKDVSYNIAMGNNAITNAMCLNTRDIIENQNANYRALHEELVANKLEAKNDRIAELNAQVNKLQLAASQEAQTNYLVSKLGPKCAEAAYIVPNPNCCYNYQVTQCNPCGCGNY